MAAGKVFPAVGLATAGGRILPSPSEFYLTGEDRLRIVSCNALAGVSLKVQWRTVDPEGDVKPNSQDHTPNSDRTVRSQDFELGTGSLLNVTVFANAGAPRIGQTYVMVQLVRGLGAAAIVLGTLLAGCVTTTQALGFPGSPILNSSDAGYVQRTISGTTPAAGAAFLEAVPTGARWEVVSILASYQASGIAGNRATNLLFASGASPIAISPTLFIVTAGQLVTYAWMAGIGDTGSNLAFGVWRGLVPALGLRGGDHFNSFTSGMDVGDQWGALIYTVREWLEVP